MIVNYKLHFSKQHFSPEARSKRREREELEVKTQYFKEKVKYKIHL